MKTKEELLKIYWAYLPYELKIETVNGIFQMNSIDLIGEYPIWAKIMWDEDKLQYYPRINIRDSGTGYGFKPNKIKPILYSMDMLTKEIEHKGERFIPILKWCDIPDTIELIGVGYEKNNYYAKFGFNAEIVTYKIPSDIDSMNYYTVKKLLEWNFNVFGLDESEYIQKQSVIQK